MPIALIATFVGPYLYSAMFPNWGNTKDYNYYKEEQKEAAQAGGWCMIFPTAYYIVIQLLLMENQKWVATLIQVPILLFACCYMYYTYIEMHDNGIYWMIYTFFFVICGLLGYVMLFYYYNKYLKLHKLNASHTDKLEDKVGANKITDQNDVIR